MAQTGYTPILIYSSSTTTNAPAAGSLTNSTLGSELAINITDGKLFYKDNANAVQVIGWKTVPTTAGGTGLTSYTAGDTVYYATGTTLTKLAIGSNKTIMTSTGSAPQWSVSLDTSQGGTGQTSYTAGDLIYYATGTAFTKLAIGSAYQALQVNAGGTAPSYQASATSVLTTQGDLLYASAANTLARLAKNTTATRYLSNTGTSNNPAWAQVDLTNGVTGTLPTANGGTGLASFTANQVFYASSTSAVAQSSSLTFNGTTFATNLIEFNTVGNGIAKTGTFTRNSGAASGNVAYTGVGFKPSFVVFFGSIDTIQDFFIGGGTTSAGRALYNNFANATGTSNQAVPFYLLRNLGGGNSDIQSATIASMDSDGFTLTYTRTRTGSGTANDIVVNYIAFR